MHIIIIGISHPKCVFKVNIIMYLQVDQGDQGDQVFPTTKVRNMISKIWDKSNLLC